MSADSELQRIAAEIDRIDALRQQVSANHAATHTELKAHIDQINADTVRAQVMNEELSALRTEYERTQSESTRLQFNALSQKQYDFACAFVKKYSLYEACKASHDEFADQELQLEKQRVQLISSYKAEQVRLGGLKGSSQWATQDRNADATIRVSGGYDRRTHGDFDPESQRTDVEIFDKTVDCGVEKTHLSIDTDGDTTVWHGNESFEH